METITNVFTSDGKFSIFDSGMKTTILNLLCCYVHV